MMACNAVQSYSPESTGGNTTEDSGASRTMRSTSFGNALLLRGNYQGGGPAGVAAHGLPGEGAEQNSSRRTLFSPLVAVANAAATTMSRVVGGAGENALANRGIYSAGSNVTAEGMSIGGVPEGALVPVSLSPCPVEIRPDTAWSREVQFLQSRCEKVERENNTLFEQKVELCSKIFQLQSELHHRDQHHGQIYDEEFNRLQEQYQERINTLTSQHSQELAAVRAGASEEIDLMVQTHRQEIDRQRMEFDAIATSIALESSRHEGQVRELQRKLRESEESRRSTLASMRSTIEENKEECCRLVRTVEQELREAREKAATVDRENAAIKRRLEKAVVTEINSGSTGRDTYSSNERGNPYDTPGPPMKGTSESNYTEVITPHNSPTVFRLDMEEAKRLDAPMLTKWEIENEFEEAIDNASKNNAEPSCSGINGPPGLAAAANLEHTAQIDEATPTFVQIINDNITKTNVELKALEETFKEGDRKRGKRFLEYFGERIAPLEARVESIRNDIERRGTDLAPPHRKDLANVRRSSMLDGCESTLTQIQRLKLMIAIAQDDLEVEMQGTAKLAADATPKACPSAPLLPSKDDEFGTPESKDDETVEPDTVQALRRITAAKDEPVTLLSIGSSVRVYDGQGGLKPGSRRIVGIDAHRKTYFVLNAHDRSSEATTVKFDEVVYYEDENGACPSSEPKQNNTLATHLAPVSKATGVPLLPESIRPSANHTETPEVVQGVSQHMTTKIYGTLTSFAAKGTRKIQCKEYDEFSIGQTVCIAMGKPNEEYLKIRAKGSLVFETELRHDHLSGETIETIPVPQQTFNTDGTSQKIQKCEPIDLGPCPNAFGLRKWEVRARNVIGLSFAHDVNYAEDYFMSIKRASALEELDEPSTTKYPHLRLQVTKAFTKLADKNPVLNSKVEAMMERFQADNRQMTGRHIGFLMYDMLEPRRYNKQLWGIKELTHIKLRGDHKDCTHDQLEDFYLRLEMQISRTPQSTDKEVVYELVSEHIESELRRVRILRRDWEDYDRSNDEMTHEEQYLFIRDRAMRITEKVRRDANRRDIIGSKATIVAAPATGGNTTDEDEPNANDDDSTAAPAYRSPRAGIDKRRGRSGERNSSRERRTSRDNNYRTRSRSSSSKSRSRSHSSRGFHRSRKFITKPPTGRSRSGSRSPGGRTHIKSKSMRRTTRSPVSRKFVCHEFIKKGKCSYGNRCRYSHNTEGRRAMPAEKAEETPPANTAAVDAAPGTSKPPGDTKHLPCRLWTNNGKCHFGESCKFSHAFPQKTAAPAEASASNGSSAREQTPAPKADE